MVAEEAERTGAHVVSLSERFGVNRAMVDTAGCIELSVAEYVGAGEVA